MAATPDDSRIATFRLRRALLRVHRVVRLVEARGVVWQLAEHLIGLYSAGMRLPFASGNDDFDAERDDA